MPQIIPTGERVTCLVSGMLEGPGVVLGHSVKEMGYMTGKEEWVVYLVRDTNTGKVMEIAGDWVREVAPGCFGSGDLIPNGTRVACNIAGILRGGGIVVGHELKEVMRGLVTDRWVVYHVRDVYTGLVTQVSETWLEPVQH